MTLIFLVKKLQNTLDKFTIFETIFFSFCFDALCLSHSQSIHTIAKLCLVCVYGAENLVIAKLHISTEILMNSVFFPPRSSKVPLKCTILFWREIRFPNLDKVLYTLNLTVTVLQQNVGFLTENPISTL